MSTTVMTHAELLSSHVDAALREGDCIDIQIAFERIPARWMQDEFTSHARELGVEVDE